MPVHPRLAHRGGLETQLAALHPPAETFKALGGRKAVAKLVDALYDRLLADPHLRGMFSATTTGERVRQKAFFEEWLGGEPCYARHYAARGLRQIHHEIHITKQDAARWLGHFRDAMRATGCAPKAQEKILRILRPLALALANQKRPAAGAQRCIHDRTQDALGKAAARGQPKVMAQALKADPDRGARWDRAQQTLLFRAAAAGNLGTLEKLLRLGAPPNVASSTGWARPMRTPLTQALANGHHEAAAMLRAHGAKDDIFSHAALGDLEGLRRELAHDPALANAGDPAHDAYRLTPLHHAVAAGQREAARFLLENGAQTGRYSTLLARWAAEQCDGELLKFLLDHGADATRVGPGEWVLHPEIAALLDAHGADPGYASGPFGSWIWQVCSGNQGRKDHPELTAAILARGVDVNSIELWGKGALHFAAKAGFVRTVELLLQHKADPNLRDTQGETPLFYAFRAGKSSNHRPVVAALLRAGADPELRDKKGRTVAEVFPKAAALVTRHARR